MLSKQKLIPILVVAVLLIIGTAIVKDKDSGTIMAASPNKVSVKAYQVNFIEKNSTNTYKASLEATEEGTVSSKVSGKVIQVMFENGQVVSQGAPLVKLDDQDILNNIASSESKLKSLQINLEKNQLNLENAQRSYERTKYLFDQGAVPKVDLEAAETSLKSAQIDLESTKANINSAQIDLNNLKNSLDNTTITAPVSGVMDGKSVELGLFANVGATFGKVKNISPINAVIEVGQDDLSSVKVGQAAKVKVGTKEYDGAVKTIEASADPNARVFKCKIEVPNQEQSLKPGMYANVDIISNQKAEMLVVPTDALGGTPGNYSVFVNEDGIARKHAVSIGEIAEGYVEIKSGLSKGDNVIITNVNTLQDGDEVTVVKE
ncbi:RND family efflux transporter, MFP subunit [Desulfosporosinus orientis DSM 765]|uniref:RND family efflux transporter, MFP subunit n=1 Tax=Desulfosporosinus orientis (strain ATCC 19365 / DSM 765 / NCIMB 8382 / VKM B-1628 / Singapore I) TaxID=768706 RepID=G7W6B9_DESOD|nr:efflux RND transporter periplasmic adaptor subunit [Desulfosporosinus orientis]AET68126.1 RND family efflux transporter, MFP subunit [Desulfosporosinus orientis DSM 765]